MSSKTEEAKIRDKVLKYAHKRGIRTIRMYFGPGIQAGWPDDLFLIPGGRPLFIEFKALGKKPTPKQQRKLDLLHEAGYAASCIDNAEHAEIVIENLLFGAKHWADDVRRKQ